LSILDGWWNEADYVRTGWPIGSGEVYEDQKYQDRVEANALYDLLEQEVAPLFYDHRDEEDVPRRWVKKMKDAIRLNTPRFNTARMVREYAFSYFEASDRYQSLTKDKCQPAKELASWKHHLFEHWYEMKIRDIDISAPADIQVNENVAVKALIDLGKLNPQDVQVQLYVGSVNEDGEITNGTPIGMQYQGQNPDDISIYTGNISYDSSGLQGFSLRVLPQHDNLSNVYEPRLILWAEGAES
jgi:starch phosphorylase